MSFLAAAIRPAEIKLSRLIEESAKVNKSTVEVGYVTLFGGAAVGQYQKAASGGGKAPGCA